MTSTLGTTGNPIRCDKPIGERNYLNQLVSETHGFIQYKRMGSFRTEGNILDGYAILNLEGEQVAELYFDMYHSGYIEESVPEGFRRIDPEAIEGQLFGQMFDADLIPIGLRSQIVISQDSHRYVEEKAQRLVLCGPLYYRTQDYFGYPRVDWKWRAIVDASRQLVQEFSGRLESNPIKVVDASVANQLLKTFHFDSDNTALIDSTMDPVLVCAKHSVTEASLQFWFQRSTFEEENLHQ